MAPVAESLHAGGPCNRGATGTRLVLDMSTLHQLSPTLSCVISAAIGPSDRPALLELFARSSPETRRDRFHHALSVFPEAYLDDILSGRQLALVARDACHPENFGKAFGLASAAEIGPGTAEFAVWVEDAWQGHGVGSLLTRAIFAELARAGYRTAIGIVEPGNLAVRRMIGRVAPRHRVRAEDGVLVITVQVACNEPRDDPVAGPHRHRPSGRKGE
jgi:GNAT superfamily N-acetyltransferase